MSRIFSTLLVLSLAATPVFAQGKSNEHKNKSKTTVTTHVDEHGNVITTTNVKAKGGAPSFCRSGAGHPVYGRDWCIEKGFGLGSNRWNRATWSDVVFQQRRSPSVAEVLSSVVLGRLTNYSAQTLGLSSPLTGNWILSSPTRTVYMVRSANTPVAEFVDTNGDGRAEYVLLYKR